MTEDELRQFMSKYWGVGCEFCGQGVVTGYLSKYKAVEDLAKQTQGWEVVGGELCCPSCKSRRAPRATTAIF